MIQKRYDVIVVGAGPAGGTAAYELARRGMQVLVLEKERLPRYKTCAGGVPLKTIHLLDLDLRSACEMEITKGKCTYRGDSPVLLDFARVVGWTVMRDKLDHLILQAATNAGARVLDCQRVREVESRPDRAFVRTSGQEYSCLVVVGADGANGVVARSAGLMQQRRLAVAVNSEIRAEERVLETEHGCVHFDFGYVPRGYGWLFPKTDHVSVGVCTFQGTSTRLKACFFNFLRQLGLPADPENVRVRGHFVPLGGVDRVLHSERILLTGDAAGLAEPMTGEGIYYAVKSAKVAAEVIYQTLEDDTLDLSPYTEQVNARVTTDLKYAGRLASLLYRLPQLSFHFFAKNPLVRWGIAEVLYGDSTFEQLYYRLLKNSPRILLSALL